MGGERPVWTVRDARLFATAAHAALGQVRKYTGEPYIVHPLQVHAVLVSIGITDPEMLAAALLHDVLEMTSVSEELLQQEFGTEVASLVRELTPASSRIDGDRASRNVIECNHLKCVSDRAKTIKMADIYSNCSTIAELDPEFARVYLSEKRDQLAVLSSGSPTMFEMALGEKPWRHPVIGAPPLCGSQQLAFLQPPLVWSRSC